MEHRNSVAQNLVEEKLVLSLATADRIGQNYKIALDGLDGINNTSREVWTEHYLVHKSRIDKIIVEELLELQRVAKLQTGGPTSALLPESSGGYRNYPKSALSVIRQVRNPDFTDSSVPVAKNKKKRPRPAPIISDDESDEHIEVDSDEYIEGNLEEEHQTTSEDLEPSGSIQASSPLTKVRQTYPEPRKSTRPAYRLKNDRSRDTTGKIRFPNINRDLPTSSDAEEMGEEGEVYNEADIRLFAKYCAMNPNIPIGHVACLFHAKYPTRREASVWPKAYHRYAADLEPLIKEYKALLETVDQDISEEDIPFGSGSGLRNGLKEVPLSRFGPMLVFRPKFQARTSHHQNLSRTRPTSRSLPLKHPQKQLVGRSSLNTTPVDAYESLQVMLNEPASSTPKSIRTKMLLYQSKYDSRVA